LSEAVRGSQKWMQIAVNQKPDVLDSVMSTPLSLPPDEQLTWLSPLERDGCKEYADQAFIDLLGVELTERRLSDFWPKGGPHWDALGKTTKGRLLLVEAKAHIPEVVSPPSAATASSLKRIRESLEEVRRYLGVRKDVDWSGWFYQYTNRLAHLYLLRELNGLPAELVFVCFVNDEDMGGPTGVEQWKGAVELLEAYLGLPRNHRLSDFVHHVCLDIRRLL
jgi:hypothetical protein